MPAGDMMWLKLMSMLSGPCDTNSASRTATPENGELLIVLLVTTTPLALSAIRIAVPWLPSSPGTVSFVEFDLIWKFELFPNRLTKFVLFTAWLY